MSSVQMTSKQMWVLCLAICAVWMRNVTLLRVICLRNVANSNSIAQICSLDYTEWCLWSTRVTILTQLQKGRIMSILLLLSYQYVAQSSFFLKCSYTYSESLTRCCQCRDSHLNISHSSSTLVSSFQYYFLIWKSVLNSFIS